MVTKHGYFKSGTSSFFIIIIWRPLISIAYSYASEAYFHNFVSLSTKTPLLKVKTIAECGLDNKRWLA